ncbi:MAG: DinB family protein [Fimbriimonas sp.]
MRSVELLRADAQYAFERLRETLAGVEERHAWARLPEGGQDFLHTDASIQGIVLHVAGGKRMYGSVGFRGTATRWRDVAAQMDRFEPSWEGALRYLDECHADWMDAWAGLTDEGLEEARPRPQGDAWPAWKILELLSHHDSYHAGQIAILRYAVGESDVPPPKSADDVRQYCAALPSW